MTIADVTVSIAISVKCSRGKLQEYVPHLEVNKSVLTYQETLQIKMSSSLLQISYKFL